MAEKIVKDSQGLVKDLVNDCISRQAAIDAIGKTSDELYENIKKGATFPQRQWFDGMAQAQSILENLPSAQPDAVTVSLEELINDYGEDGFFIVDGVNYQANELLNELKTNSSVGEKFRKQITKTIVQYLMKFGG